MVMVAVRDLRNNTAQVIQKAREGETVVLTSRGDPVARSLPMAPEHRPYLTPMEVLAIPQADPGLRRDLARLGGDDTDQLGPIQ